MQEIHDQVILVTGATDGLGKRVAHDLAERGATLLLHGRSPEKGEATLQEIRRATGNDKARYFNADFASLAAVRRLAKQVQANYDRLDVLINNAGIGAVWRLRDRREESADGYELRFQVNYLAPFLLTRRLVPLLRRSAPARIVNVASVGQQPIDFGDVMLENEYDSFDAYRRSKLALVMFTFDLADKLSGSGVTANSLHPASLMRTNMVNAYFGRAVRPLFHWMTSTILRWATTTIDEGAEAVEYLATSPRLDGITGKYFDGKQRAQANAQAYDEEARRRLRRLSVRLTDLTDAT